ncbi:MAG: threonine/serine exporter family protein [Anaerolineae bacterium]|nr:threonine/serine exporter family protein [Anaerolineae bacterium]
MTVLELAQQVVWGFVATFGFGVLFNVPTRMLVFCGLTGAAGHACRWALVQQDVHMVSATFVGAVVVGLLGYAEAQRFHLPRSIFTVTGIIPLVPGVPAFETLVYLMRDSITEGLAAAVTTGLRSGAIASGLVAARLLSLLVDKAHRGERLRRWQQRGD